MNVKVLRDIWVGPFGVPSGAIAEHITTYEGIAICRLSSGLLLKIPAENIEFIGPRFISTSS